MFLSSMDDSTMSSDSMHRWEVMINAWKFSKYSCDVRNCTIWPWLIGWWTNSGTKKVSSEWLLKSLLYGSSGTVSFFNKIAFLFILSFGNFRVSWFLKRFLELEKIYLIQRKIKRSYSFLAVDRFGVLCSSKFEVKM